MLLPQKKEDTQNLKNYCPRDKQNLKNYCPRDKQNLKNYCPISLLSIVGKIFENVFYNNMYEFFAKNNLISPNQSDFKPGDSCINQLLSITHEVHKSFDNDVEV